MIPDYNLPVERMREIDSEVNFSGERLRTSAGDLGEIRFTATLQDGVFRIDPFRVRGWAGALIESDATIDASQDPPRIAWQWVARQLNYGVLLKQARFARTVEGTLDISLRLSGNGCTRHEFLGDADGLLVVVGQKGRFGSRWLDLWGSDLATIAPRLCTFRATSRLNPKATFRETRPIKRLSSSRVPAAPSWSALRKRAHSKCSPQKIYRGR